MSTNTEPKKPLVLPRLTNEKADELGAQYARFIELREMTIKTATSDAELKGITEYLANTFLNFGHDLIGCWFTVRQEYEPYLQLKARMQFRVGHILANQAAQGQKAQEEAAAPSNVIKL